MNDLLWYGLKVIICSGVLFGYYRLFLRNRVFHNYNRFYLLAVVVLSLTLPLLRIAVPQTTQAAAPAVFQMLEAVNGGDYIFEETYEAAVTGGISYTSVLFCLYIFLSSALLFMLVKSLVRIIRILAKHPVRHSGAFRIVITDNEPGTPFSFFKFLFWNSKIAQDSAEGRLILLHEYAHIKFGHTYDKLFINLALAAFWWNPVFWLIRRELSTLHEFIADNAAVEDGDTAGFASMILSTVFPNHQMHITNNFFSSSLKRRLMMITQAKKTRLNYFSRLFVLPLAVLICSALVLKAQQPAPVAAAAVSALKPPVKPVPVSQTSQVVPPAPVTELKPVVEVTPTAKPITVVLDAGHGGDDAGAMNQTGIGIKEKDVALQLVKKVAALNDNKNVKIILLRESDVTQSVSEKARMAASFKPDIFVSVHLDASPKATWNAYTGMAVFIGADPQSGSRELGSAILQAFRGAYEIPVAHQLLIRDRPLVLKANTFPSVIIEAGYITTDKDAAYLASENGQEAFARNLLNAINTYADLPEKIQDLKLQALADRLPALKEQLLDPELTFDTHKRTIISVSELQAQKEVTVSGDYKFESSLVYFSGSNFKDVVVTRLFSASLKEIRVLLGESMDGTVVTFADIKVSNANGVRTIPDKSFIVTK